MLHLVREVLPTVPVLWFKTAAVDVAFGREVIRELNLTAYDYWPADTYLLTEGGHTTLVQEYDVGESRLPLLTDLVPGDRCSLTAFPNRTPTMYLPFDLLFVGYKDSDTHWVLGDKKPFEGETVVGRARMVAPIRHMSDDKVRGLIADLKINYREGDDSLPMCTRCMTQDTDEVWCPERRQYIPVEQWNRELALGGFRKRFGLT